MLQKIEDYNLTKQKYFEYIQLYIKKKKSSQTKFYMQLNSIRNCKKKIKNKKRKGKKKGIFGCKK